MIHFSAEVINANGIQPYEASPVWLPEHELQPPQPLEFVRVDALVKLRLKIGKVEVDESSATATELRFRDWLQNLPYGAKTTVRQSHNGGIQSVEHVPTEPRSASRAVIGIRGEALFPQFSHEFTTLLKVAHLTLNASGLQHIENSRSQINLATVRSINGKKYRA